MRTTSTIQRRPGAPARRERQADVALAALFIYAGGVSSASAYVDPGSGAAIITGILGFLGAVAYTTRKYWYRLKRVLTGKGGEKTAPPPR